MSAHSRRITKHFVLLIVASTIWVGASIGVAASGLGSGSFVIPGGARIQVGTKPGALDLSDSSDMLATSGVDWQGGIYHSQATDGWDGTDGFYWNDYRAPLLPGESKSWVVYFCASPGSAPRDASLGFSWSSADPNVVGKIEYIQAPSGTVGGPEVGTVWTARGDHWVQLPYYSALDGLTGYAFKLTLTMVPEPSSILALGVGFAGLCGFALRRRR